MLLAGCADKTVPTDHDWPEATYIVTCDGVVPTGFQVSLHKGAGTEKSKTPDYASFDVKLEATATGDLDGDGKPDTVVLLQCHPQPSNGLVEEVQVFNAHDQLIAGLPSPRTLREQTILPPVYDPAGLRVENGDIVAGMKAYGPDDSHASGPSIPITVRWHWNGHSFVRVD
ncbi:hypothetical protein [Petropleomorpha daqingensis]|uniref:Uncharacterized protein n=1 Tax=Petropleomorpha daqingensis TaxID=2026353 RepID=A0A853C9P6_9ACTN|nr:hypothetical protein [Petropleomorpha daqingensis]NYJ03881.1 hypothetical protein [Petropleomorpha daqingensis]